MQNFDQPDGIDFVDAAGLRVVAYGRWIAGDGENIAHAADGPGAEKYGLQADDVVVAGGEVRDGFDSAGLERARGHERVHDDASHGAAADVDGVHVAAGHDFVDLLEDA